MSWLDVGWHFDLAVALPVVLLVAVMFWAAGAFDDQN